MQILTGTNGYSYKEWKDGSAEKMKEAEMLAFAGRFHRRDQNTFTHAHPRLLRKWAEQTPDAFTFVLNAAAHHPPPAAGRRQR
jgi:uncharacterized protein YecE (DUF72 family)